MQKTESVGAVVKQKIKLIEIALLGALRGMVSLPLQHPFDTVKTWMQSQNKSTGQTISTIYKNKGIRGFYSGFTINVMRVMSKSAYRWPLNVYFMAEFRKIFKGYNNSKTLAGVATGITISLIESGIICPFERIKVWLMTSPQYRGLTSYFKLAKLKTIFDGLMPVMLKQTVSWVSFLGSQQYLKEVVYRYHNKTEQEYELNTYDLTFVSILVCLCNTLFVMPADYIKTHYQKYENSSKGTTIRSFAADVYRNGGIRQFYRGAGVKIIQYNINAFLTVQLFERVMRSYQKHP